MLLDHLNNLKVRTKLTYFLFVPILTLLYFSISGIHLKYQDYTHTQRSLDFISVSLKLSDLIHELQKERGLSAGFVGSEGTLYRDILIKQRKKTDEQLNQFNQDLNKRNPDKEYWGLYDLFIRLQHKLTLLSDIRPKIDSLKKGDFFGMYSEINAMGLDICKHLQTLINNIDLSRQTDSYVTLLWLQERSGQERGLLNGIFSSGRLDAKRFKALISYISAQETLTAHFYTIATLKHKTMLRKEMRHPVIKEVRKLQTAAINKATKNDLLNSLQILIGYGGLIHNFKNYVIRGQQQYTDKYNKLFNEATNIIDEYRKLPGMSQKEIISLNTIEKTFLQYQKHLIATKDLWDSDNTIRKIDSNVKVNDKPALRAIEYLHQSVTGLDTSTWWDKATTRLQLIKEVSDVIRIDMLNQTQKIMTATTQSLYLYIILTIGSLTLSAILGYLLIHRLVGGILNISTHLTSMQKQNDFETTIKLSGNDEIAEVASAFNNLINERKKSEEKLRLAASVLNKTNEALVVTDTNNHITMVNPAFTKITGYELEEVIGKNPSFLQSGQHDKSFYQNMWNTILKNGHWIGEVYNKRKNGDIYPELLNVSAIKNDQGEIIMHIGMFLDISERKQSENKQELLQRQLLQAQKMEALGQLTGGIAHDFNNMLSIILGYTALATDHIKAKNKDDELQEYLDVISQTGDRAKYVVSQLLAFSRSGEDIELQPLDAEILLSESIKMIRPLLPSTIKLTPHITSHEMIILVNPVKIHQILLNLCINARDAINEHGSIEFRAQKISIDNAICNSCHENLSGDFIEISISDNGTGIDPKNIGRLFDPFFTTKEMGSEKGTGMGLAMVHGIMHEHNGHIIVESILGKGSKFRLLFPLHSGTNTAEAEKTNTNNETEAKAPLNTDNNLVHNILCVDDEQSLVTLMKEILEIQGYQVTAFTDSQLALSHFNEHPEEYDLVITDQTMPQLTGTEMARAMLKTQPDTPIILCSGYSDNIDKTDAETFGIIAYMQKPLNMKSLISTISQLKNPNS